MHAHKSLRTSFELRFLTDNNEKSSLFLFVEKNSILIKKNVCDLVVYWLHRIHGISCLLTAKSKHHIYEAGDKILHYYIFAKMSTRFNLYLLDIQCSGYHVKFYITFESLQKSTRFPFLCIKSFINVYADE